MTTEMTGARSEPESGWWQKMTCAGSMTPTDRRNSRRFTIWLLSWAVCVAAATISLAAEGGPGGPLAWVVAIVPDLVGVGALLAYVRFLRQADELLQKIQLEGLAFGFGVGVVVAMGYRLLERAGAPRLDIDDPVVLMMFAWALGQFLARRRYR